MHVALFLIPFLYYLGLKELSPPPLNLKRLYRETLEIEPILIIISPGADPSQELQELANVERSGECYHQVSTHWPLSLPLPLPQSRALSNIPFSLQIELGKTTCVEYPSLSRWAHSTQGSS